MLFKFQWLWSKIVILYVLVKGTFFGTFIGNVIPQCRNNPTPFKFQFTHVNNLGAARIYSIVNTIYLSISDVELCLYSNPQKGWPLRGLKMASEWPQVSNCVARIETRRQRPPKNGIGIVEVIFELVHLLEVISSFY